MKSATSQRAPLTDLIAFALAKMVDDAQTERRDPSHSDIGFGISNCGLTQADPNTQGQTVGKAKRVRSVLTWAIENAFDSGCALVAHLVGVIRSCGGFRAGSPNYVGEEAVENLREAMSSEGFVLGIEGDLRPAALDTLAGVELTDALWAYIRRAQRGSEDAALVVGTGKDLLEAIAAHVLRESWGYSPKQLAEMSFPMLLGQAFVALDLKTPPVPSGTLDAPQFRLQRALYEAACAINTLRNKEGTGHGHPWLPSVTPEEARHVIQTMGVVGELLLRKLKHQKSP